MEEIFLASAKKNMTTFNLELFKKTHPKLYFTIIDAMVTINNENTKSLNKKLMKSIPTPVELYREANLNESDSDKKMFVKGSNYILDSIKKEFQNG